MPHVVAEFVEKPDAERAEEFVACGELLLERRHLRDEGRAGARGARRAGGAEARIADVARWIAAQPPEDRNGDEARERFAALESLSIDTAVMERCDRVAVIPAALKWSDVGSLLALGRRRRARRRAATCAIGRGVDIDSSNTIVYSSDRLVATLGVEDLIVVDTTDATLVLPKDRAQDVRQVVDALKAMGAPEVTQPKVSLRPWGMWTSLLKDPGYQIKLLEIKPGCRAEPAEPPPPQRALDRRRGTAMVTRDDERIEVHVNESVFIPVGAVHRIENCGKVPLAGHRGAGGRVSRRGRHRPDRGRLGPGQQVASLPDLRGPHRSSPASPGRAADLSAKHAPEPDPCGLGERLEDDTAGDLRGTVLSIDVGDGDLGDFGSGVRELCEHLDEEGVAV